MLYRLPLKPIYFQKSSIGVDLDNYHRCFHEASYDTYFAMIQEPVSQYLHSNISQRRNRKSFATIVNYMTNFSRFSALSNFTFGYLRDKHPQIILDTSKIFMATDDEMKIQYPQLDEYKISLQNEGEQSPILNFAINAHCGLFLQSVQLNCRWDRTN